MHVPSAFMAVSSLTASYVLQIPCSVAPLRRTCRVSPVPLFITHLGATSHVTLILWQCIGHYRADPLRSRSFAVGFAPSNEQGMEAHPLGQLRSSATVEWNVRTDERVSGGCRSLAARTFGNREEVMGCELFSVLGHRNAWQTDAQSPCKPLALTVESAEFKQHPKTDSNSNPPF